MSKAKRRVDELGIEFIPNGEPKLADPDRINVYVCQKCGRFTVTLDIHEGVTPFMIRCRASGREGDCNGEAFSSFYPKTRPIPSHIPPPAWEWFSPRGSEYHKLNEAMQHHVAQGGLDLRRRMIGHDPGKET